MSRVKYTAYDGTEIGGALIDADGFRDRVYLDGHGYRSIDRSNLEPSDEPPPGADAREGGELYIDDQIGWVRINAIALDQACDGTCWVMDEDGDEYAGIDLDAQPNELAPGGFAVDQTLDQIVRVFRRQSHPPHNLVVLRPDGNTACVCAERLERTEAPSDHIDELYHLDTDPVVRRVHKHVYRDARGGLHYLPHTHPKHAKAWDKYTDKERAFERIKFDFNEDLPW